ncbi:MAG: adenylate/guanylate cyclase domain-containing protein, partial [Spirochaetaceae bacterium]
EHLMQFLNSYMDRVVGQQVVAAGGFIDKFIGDAVMAVFSDAGPDSAIKAAIGIQKALLEYNRELAANGEPPIRTGIGINTGEVIMGTVGTQSRMDSTMIGDEVNLASRLESLTKQYNTGIIASENTIRALKNPDEFFIMEIDSVTVKGKSEAVSIFGIYDYESMPVQQARKANQQSFQQARQQYRQRNFQQAADLFRGCLENNPDDVLLNLYIQRCEHYLATPPDDSWNGSISLSQK